MSDETAPEPSCLVHVPSSSLSVSLSHAFSWILHFNWKLPLFSAWQSGCRFERRFFFLHRSEKMSLFLASVGIRLLQLSSTESRYSMWVPVLIISTLLDIKMPSPYTLFPPPNTVTYPTQMLQRQTSKKRIGWGQFCLLFLMCNTIFCLFICSYQSLLIYQAQLPAEQEQKYTIANTSQSYRQMREQRGEEGRQQPAASPVADSLLSQLDPVRFSFSLLFQ